MKLQRLQVRLGKKKKPATTCDTVANDEGWDLNDLSIPPKTRPSKKLGLCPMILSACITFHFLRSRYFVMIILAVIGICHYCQHQCSMRTLTRGETPQRAREKSTLLSLRTPDTDAVCRYGYNYFSVTKIIEIEVSEPFQIFNRSRYRILANERTNKW